MAFTARAAAEATLLTPIANPDHLSSKKKDSAATWRPVLERGRPELHPEQIEPRSFELPLSGDERRVHGLIGEPGKLLRSALALFGRKHTAKFCKLARLEPAGLAFYESEPAVDLVVQGPGVLLGCFPYLDVNLSAAEKFRDDKRQKGSWRSSSGTGCTERRLRGGGADL
jgi:hypothetical protein